MKLSRDAVRKVADTVKKVQGLPPGYASHLPASYRAPWQQPYYLIVSDVGGGAYTVTRAVWDVGTSAFVALTDSDDPEFNLVQNAWDSGARAGAAPGAAVPGSKLWVNGTWYLVLDISNTASGDMLQHDFWGSWHPDVHSTNHPVVGDLVYRDAGVGGVLPIWERLAIGQAGQVLTVVNGLPAWAAGIGKHILLDDAVHSDTLAGAQPPAAGSMIAFTPIAGANPAANAWQELLVGNNGEVLKVVNGSPAWGTAPSTLLLDATAHSDTVCGPQAPGRGSMIVYAPVLNVGDAWQELPVGDPGDVLTVDPNNDPTWEPLPLADGTGIGGVRSYRFGRDYKGTDDLTGATAIVLDAGDWRDRELLVYGRMSNDDTLPTIAAIGGAAMVRASNHYNGDFDPVSPGNIMVLSSAAFNNLTATLYADNADGGKLKLKVINNTGGSVQRFVYFHILEFGHASVTDGDYTDIGNRV